MSIWVFRVRIGKSTCIMLDFQMCNGTNHCSVATVNDYKSYHEISSVLFSHIQVRCLTVSATLMCNEISCARS